MRKAPANRASDPYASSDNSAHLIERMESRNGLHTLEAAESLGVGSRTYELLEIKA